MITLFLRVEIDGQEVPVTLDEIMAFLKEDEKRDFKDLIAICREDHWRVQAAANENSILDISNEDVLRASERLAENAMFFYLIVKERMRACLRGLDRTMDFTMKGG